MKMSITASSPLQNLKSTIMMMNRHRNLVVMADAIVIVILLTQTTRLDGLVCHHGSL